MLIKPIVFLTFSLPLCHWIAKVLNVLRVGILIESHLKRVLKKTFINNNEKLKASGLCEDQRPDLLTTYFLHKDNKKYIHRCKFINVNKFTMVKSYTCLLA